MSSLFEKLYQYKQSDKRDSKENFLTEIFAFCLQNDLIFRKGFLSLIECKLDCSDFKCETQYFIAGYRKPDIYIRLDNDTSIIIECKIDSKQGNNQLNKYYISLNKSEPGTKRLIFLTKYYENISEFEANPNFKHIRWYQIFEQLKHAENIANNISRELYNYLISQKMDSKISFTGSDKNAISFISENYKNIQAFVIRS